MANNLIEDVSAGLSDIAGSLSEMQVFDTYNVPIGSIATFECKNKNIKVSGLIAESWQFSIDSKWDGKAIGALADSPLLKGIDSLFQDLSGMSVNQPFLNRRTWSGTSPFGTTVKLRFIAVTDAFSDVYMPVISLLALAYPRLLTAKGDEAQKTLLGIFSIPGPAPFGGIAQAIANAFGAQYDVKEQAGDPVSVTIGSMIELSSVYITKLQGMFSKALDHNGYPLSAELNVSFESMDTPFFVTPTDPNFSVQERINNPMKAPDTHTVLAQMFEGFLTSITKAVGEGFKTAAAAQVNQASALAASITGGDTKPTVQQASEAQRNIPSVWTQQ